MARICWQSQDEKKPRENKRGQSSKLVNATRPHSARAVSTLQIWINCSIFTSISNFYIFTESFNSKYNITAHSIVSSSLFRSTQLNNCITQLLTLDHIQEVMIQFLFFLPHPWITCKFLKVDTGLIFWTNLDQLQHFIPVNSQQHPINCIRKLPSFWPCISGADPFSFPEKELRIQMLILNKRIDSDI